MHPLTLLQALALPLLALSATSFAPPCIDVANKKIRLGVFPGLANPFKLAFASEYVEQATGWDIVWQRVYGGGMGVRMLDEGQVCMSLIGSSPIAGQQLRGQQIELIGMMDLIGDAERLVVKADIIHPSDLAGKKIVTSLDSTAHFHLLLLEDLFNIKLGAVLDADSLTHPDTGAAISFNDAWDAGYVDGIQMWGGSQSHAATNGGHKLIGAKEIGEWGKPTFDGFASRKDVSGLDATFTATLLGVLGSVNDAFLGGSPRAWDLGTDEMKAALSCTGSASNQDNYDSFMGDVAGVTILSLADQVSCLHIGCGLDGVDAQALKAVNTFKMSIKAAPVMQPDSVWAASTNAVYLQKAIDDGLVVADIDTYDQTVRDARISDLGTGYNSHDNSWSLPAAHGGECTGSVTVSSDGSISDGHQSTGTYHNNADCSWVLDSGTASDITTLTMTFLDIAAGWDTVTVREGADDTGDVIAVFSGMQSPPPISVVGPMHVKFETDGKNQIFYKDQKAGFEANVAFTSGSITACNEGLYGADCSSPYCYGKTSMTGSGNVIAEHRNSAQCYWDLTADANKVVELTFSDFDFEYQKDTVSVYDVSDAGAETLIGTFSGFDLPPKLVSAGTKMRIKLVADEVVWEGQGFTAAFASIDAPAATVCTAGQFGPYCDVGVCYGNTAIPASAGSPSGQIKSGNNYPGGIDCSWTIGAADAYDGISMTFNSVDIEPGYDDVMYVWDGTDRSTPLKTVRGKSSQCSKSDDCNPSSSSSPSTCTFASVSDLYGTCTCEEGYSNGDCSESKTTLFPTSGFVEITYTTDINDDKVYAGWDINYKVCGDQDAGFDYCDDGTWDIEQLKIGFMHPVYKESLAYDAGGHNRLVGSLMALREINADNTILANTELKFEFIDSKRSSGVALSGAYTHAMDSFDGTGADVVVGPASSGPSMNAQLVLKNFGIPQMSYSASSPDLSDSGEYPTFFRTPASDAFQGKALSQFLKNDLEFDAVCTISGLDGYSAKGTAAFVASAIEIGITVVKSIEIPENPSEADAAAAIQILGNADCRVVFMMSQAAAAGTVARHAVAGGVMGPTTGWLWALADAIAGNVDGVKATAEVDGDGAPAIDLDASLKGSIGAIPLSPSGDALDAFMTKYQAQASTAGSCTPAEGDNDGGPVVAGSCACAADTDNAGNSLFQFDHDGDASTAERCAGFVYDPSDAAYFAPNSYSYYAYDVVWAFAHAAQKVLDDGGTSFGGAALVEALKDISFEGVTGTVDFEDNGDREIGAGFTIKNHDGDAFVDLGNWDQSTGLTYASGVSVADIVWPTRSGLKPSDTPLLTEVLKMGLLFPMYSLDGTEHVYSSSGHNNMVGALMAIEEINANLDLLPNTKLTYEVYDTKHDPGTIIPNTFYLATDSFNGKGADVVVGGAYSGPTIASHNVLKSFGTPQMSYSATSPLLSDTKEYPYFLRTVPSDAFQGKAIAQFLKDDLEYTNVCVVHGDDAYNANLAAAFIYSSLELGITVVKTIETNVKPTNKQAADYIAVLKQAACRVVFLSLHSGSSPPVFREAKKAGIFGAESGWMYVVPDTITTGIADVISGATEEATFCPSNIEEGEECPLDLITTPGVAAEDFAGMMGCLPLSPSGDALAKFMEGYEALPSTVGTCGGTDKELTDDCQCASGTDAAGNKLYQRDHDNDPDTPDRCIGFVTDSTAEGYFEPEGYTYYAYDVIYAFANAAHDMITGGAESFDKAAMMAALKDVAFNSVTGTVDFETSGDREVGAGFTIKNYKPAGWEAIGNWDKGTGMVFNAGSFDDIVYPTADNSKPVNKVLPLCQPENIEVTVGACTSDSKRAASFKVMVDDDGDAVCQDGVDVPANIDVDCEYSPSDSSAGFLAYILGFVGFGVGISWAVWTFLNFNNKVIKVAQPAFCIVFAASAGFVSLSNIFFVGENTSAMCMLRPFIFNIMFDLMFGSLFMKTFRVYKIFGNKSLSKVKVSSMDVIKTYSAVMSVDVALLVIWLVTEGMEQVKVKNTVQGYWEYETEECNKAELWEFATTFFKILMVLGGVYLAYITRNVPDKFAESKWIALSIYQVFILGVVGLLVKSSSPASLLLVQGIAVPAASIVSTCCIFGPKLLMIRNPGDYDDALKTSANTSGGSGNTSSGQNSHAEELDDANNKIAELQKEIEDLKSQN